MFSNAFRGIGDGYTALYCLVVSVIGNVGLDYVFVAMLGMGVAGTAYATALAQGMSVVFAVIMLYVKYPNMRMTRRDFRPDGKLFVKVTRLAVPIAIQSGFNSLGNVVVQSCINGFGEVVMASYTVASRLGSFALMPMETIGTSLSVYAGQNLGAGKTDRIDEGVKASIKLNLIVSTILGVVLVVFSKPMTRIFLPEAAEQVMAISYRHLLYTAVPGFLYGLMYVYQHALRGVGMARESMIGSFMQLGAKVAVAACGAWLLHSLDLVWLAWPISYAAGTVYPYYVYRKGVRTE